MYGGADFGPWLRERRRELDLTQEALANLVGCSRELIKKLELGQRRPSKQVAELLAQCFNVPPEQQQTFMRFARGASGEVNLFIPSISPAITSTSLRLPSKPPNNLPAAPTPFIGREKELEQLSRLIMREGVRLVTLTGPGGIGKTRLALRVAEKLLVQEDFEDGIFFVPLASIRDPDLLIPAISHVLGVHEMGNQPLLASLKQYLHDKQMLLLLDNFEQIISASLTVADLLSASSGLKMLATSREALDLQSEYRFPVPALGMPETQTTYREPLELLTQYEAVRLFIERSVAARPDFEVTNDNAPAVAEICVRLDGLPLAIELAAARIKALPPRAILSRLQDRLKILTGGTRDLPERHQTLRSTIEWSYDLLSEEEKRLFRRLSVFRGGCSLESVGRVCSYDGKLQIQILEGLDPLISKSLLRLEEGVRGEARYVLLETIHEYAREKLAESREMPPVQRQHALYFMALAEEAEPHLTGKMQVEWLNRLEEEHDNIRAALQWASTEGSTSEEALETGLHIAVAVWRFWHTRGYLSEGRNQLHTLLSLAGMHFANSPDGTGDSSVRRANSEGMAIAMNATNAVGAVSKRAWAIKALSAAGVLAWRQGDFRVARGLLEQTVALAAELGDKTSMAIAVNALGSMTAEEGDMLTAGALWEQGLAIRREIGDKQGVASSLHNLGSVARERGDYRAAAALYRQAIEINRELGNKEGTAVSLCNLGAIMDIAGDYQTARSLLEESLCLSRELEYKDLIGITFLSLGNVTWHQGDFSTAHALLEQSLEVCREVGDAFRAANALHVQGLIACSEGDFSEARSKFRQSLSIHRELGAKSGFANELVGLGAVAAGLGQGDRAARLLGAADAHLALTGFILFPDDDRAYQQGRESARSQRGEEKFERAWQEGQTMGVEQAIDYALQEGQSE